MKIYHSLYFILLLLACNLDNKIENGVKTIYYPKSDIVKQTVEFKNGLKNGYLNEYYRDGKLKAKQFYLNDTLDDTTLIYYPSGLLQTLHVYKNKLRHGCWKDYNPKGILCSEIYFKNGLLDSTCTKYTYRTSRLLTRITYSEGDKHGAEEHYHANGKLQSRQYYHKGQICKGTEEYYSNGKKIDNDFKISITEKDAVLLENTLTYIVRLENPRPDDIVYRMITPAEGNKMGAMYPLEKKGDTFYYTFNLSKGGFVMENVIIAAYRKTSMGNTVIKTQSFNAASNNF